MDQRWDVGFVLALLAILAGGISYQLIGGWRSRRRFRPPGHFIDAGGHRLHVVCTGEGRPPVLLESGIAASSLSWSIVQPEIARFTRVCAYDRAGLAWSDAPSSPRTFDRIVDEFATVIAHMAGDDRSVLVGHSFGTFVVSAYAARHPDRVVGLVLVDPPIEWLAITKRHAHLLWGGRKLSGLGALLAQVGVVRACLALLSGGAPGAPRRFVKIFGPTAARTLERLVGEVRKLPADVHPILQELWCQPKCFHAMGAYIATLEKDAAVIAKAAPPPDIPVVVISAGDQPEALIAAHRRMANASVAGRHVVAEGTGHWVQFDRPELIVSAVQDLTGREPSRAEPA